MQLQRVRTSTGTIGVPDAASNCYLHKSQPFNICMQLAHYSTATCGSPIVTCADGLFPLSTSAFTLLPHVVVLLLLALCGGGGGGFMWW